MKYLNKNIEEIGKRANEKSLVNRSTSCGIFQKYEYNSMVVKNSIKNNKVEKYNKGKNLYL